MYVSLSVCVYTDIMARRPVNENDLIEMLTEVKFWSKLAEFVWKLIPECEDDITTEIKRALVKHLFIQLLKSGSLNHILTAIEVGCIPALLSLLQSLGVIQAIASCVIEISKKGAVAIIQDAAVLCSKEIAKQGTKQVLKQGSKEVIKQGAKKASVTVAKSAAKSTLKGAAKSTIAIGLAVEVGLYSVGMANAIYKHANGKIDTKQLKKYAVEQTSTSVGSASGSIGGSLAGGAAGAAIGSVVPVIGTAIGAAVGGLVGSIGGGLLGTLSGKGIGKLLAKEIK